MKYIALILFLFAPLANATLGEAMDPSQNGQITVRQIRSQNTPVAQHELSEPRITLHQYTGKGGKVFAVAWQGHMHPDLQQLLGTHFKDFQAALKEAKKTRRGHSPIQIDQGDLHVEMGGTPRSLFGRIWLKTQIPTGVDLNDIH